jgi:dihydropteroate synthase
VATDFDVPPPESFPRDLPAGPLTFAYRGGAWELSLRARVMGILNLTPDSFFDGGRYVGADAAFARAEAMAHEGADAIDIGAQSTRPGSVPVGPEEEGRRLEPALDRIASGIGVPVSIDTYHAEVARRALDHGVSIVNDVSGLGFDPGIAGEAARSGAGLILMHSLGAPDRLHEPREYADVAGEVRSFLEERMRVAESRGVARERIALDPGIGFSKRAEQSLDALCGISRLASLGRPVAVGVSRKSFLGALTGAPLEERLAPGIGATIAAYALGARIVRTHDVRETVAALRIAERILDPSMSGVAQGAGAGGA